MVTRGVGTGDNGVDLVFSREDEFPISDEKEKTADASVNYSGSRIAMRHIYYLSTEPCDFHCPVKPPLESACRLEPTRGTELGGWHTPSTTPGWTECREGCRCGAVPVWPKRGLSTALSRSLKAAAKNPNQNEWESGRETIV